MKSPRLVSHPSACGPNAAPCTDAMKGISIHHTAQDPPSVSFPTPRLKSLNEGEAFRLGEFGSSLARGEMDDVLSRLRRTLVVMLGQAMCLEHRAGGQSRAFLYASCVAPAGTHWPCWIEGPGLCFVSIV